MHKGVTSLQTNENTQGDFPGGPAVKTALLLQRVRVRSLVRQLRFPMLCGVAKKKKRKHTEADLL